MNNYKVTLVYKNIESGRLFSATAEQIFLGPVK